MITKELLEEAREHATYDIPRRTQELLLIMATALEKQIPQKPKITLHGTTGWNTKEHCPVCNAMVYNNYCWNCGQALK